MEGANKAEIYGFIVWVLTFIIYSNFLLSNLYNLGICPRCNFKINRHKLLSK